MATAPQHQQRDDDTGDEAEQAAAGRGDHRVDEVPEQVADHLGGEAGFPPEPAQQSDHRCSLGPQVSRALGRKYERAGRVSSR